MLVVGMREAKTHLSRLIKEAEGKGAFRIASNGKVVAEVRPLAQKRVKKRKLGGLRHVMKIPDNFDTIGQEQINRAFYGE